MITLNCIVVAITLYYWAIFYRGFLLFKKRDPYRIFDSYMSSEVNIVYFMIFGCMMGAYVIGLGCWACIKYLP